MADLGKLALNITADPSGFQSGLMAAQNSALKFGSTVTSTFSNLGANIAALAGSPLGAITLIGAALYKLGQTAIKDAAEMGKLMNRFSLTADQVAGLQQRAREMGIAFEDVQDALPKFTGRLGQAAMSGGALETSLASIGLSSRNLANMPLTEALGTIGDALNKVKNPAEKAALEMEILGKHGMGLRGIMRDGAAGMAAAEETARKLGLSYGTSADQLRQLARAQREISVAMKTFEKTAGAAAGPLVAAGTAWVTLSFLMLTKGPEAAKQFWAEIEHSSSALGEFSHNFEESQRAVNEYLAKTREGIANLADPLEREITMFERLGASAQKVSELRALQVDRLIAQISKQNYSIEQQALRAARTVGELNRVEQAIWENAQYSQFISGQNLQTNIYGDITRMRATLGVAGEAERQVAAFVAMNRLITADQRRSLEWAAQQADQWRLFVELTNSAITPLEQLQNQLQLMDGFFPEWSRDYEGAIEEANEAIRQHQRLLRDEMILSNHLFQFEPNSPRELRQARYVAELQAQLRDMQADLADLEAGPRISDEQAAFYGNLVRRFIAANGGESQGSPQLAAGLTVGSQQAISMINQNAAQDGSNDPIERLRMIAERQLRTQENQLIEDRRISEALLRGDIFQVLPIGN